MKLGLASARALAVLSCSAAIGFVMSGSALSAPLPSESSVSLVQALQTARASRAELRASAARIDAARQRPQIVASLEDPILAPSIDHKPVEPGMKTDRSITFEQSFPLSGIRGHRRRAAEADVDKFQGEASRTRLRVETEVAQAYFMLDEKRKIGAILERQVALAAQLVKLAAARHGVGAVTQADVLRAEIEEARLRTRQALAGADVRAAEAMFNAAMGVERARPVAALLDRQVPGESGAGLDAALEQALGQRPELRISQAEIRRARAEVDVMKAMYKPMAMVRVGMAETGAAGRGYMLMVGVSVPLWFGRLRAGVREAGSMAVMAEADREAMLRMIEGDVAASLAAYQGAAANVEAFRTNLLPRAERAIGPALSAYAAGSLPLSSVLEAGKALWSVQEEAVMADTALASAWIRYRGALGSFGDDK